MFSVPRAGVVPGQVFNADQWDGYQADQSTLPGNHGHPATLPIPFSVGGGSPLVAVGRTSTAAARTVDVAPTVGSIFGLAAPPGGYDGTARTEAFTDSRTKRPR